jgi:hypothetical protein
VFTCVVFSGYLSGASFPPWDFWGSYTTSAYTWWTLGSLFSPPEILPYMLGGYPAYLEIQNAAWFLPVGLTSLATAYTPHAAATLQVFTVAFGSIGAYLLGRSLGLRRTACVLVGLGFLQKPVGVGPQRVEPRDHRPVLDHRGRRLDVGAREGGKHEERQKGNRGKGDAKHMGD